MFGRIDGPAGERIAVGNVSNWILGGMSGVFAVAALFVAARAGHGVGYYGGLAMFAFCILFIMFLMKKGFDHRDHHA